MDTFLSQKIPEFYCEKCKTGTDNKKDFNKHLLTRKHQMDTFGYIVDTCFSKKLNNNYTCICGNKYKYSQGLSKHKKICPLIKENQENQENQKKQENKEILILDASSNQPETQVCLSMMMDLIKQNQAILLENNEFKELIIEQNKQMIEIAKEGNNKNIINNNNNTINNNNKFNLNFFLNEQCKDAMNIMDFANSLKIKMMEVENVGSHGYAEGISNIIIRGLKELDIFKRPIHCSDLKREVLHIKNNDAWEKDNEQKQLVCAIKKVARNNFMQVAEWKQQHPDYMNQESPDHDFYCKIIEESSSGDQEKYNKIIRTVAKEVIIEKI